MKLLLYSLAPLSLFTTPAFTANCINTDGVANGECVRVFAQSYCSTFQTSYRPTCAGNCYVYNFNALRVSGDGTYGTNCYAYSDTNCQNYIGQTGNTKSVNCQNFPGGKSMKCYYRC